jgi:hypothetical protein
MMDKKVIDSDCQGNKICQIRGVGYELQNFIDFVFVLFVYFIAEPFGKGQTDPLQFRRIDVKKQPGHKNHRLQV